MNVEVIIPVGPGHERLVDEAMQSVRIASYTSMGQFKDVTIRVIPDERGELGRSRARNIGIKDSKADWLFFLDADDFMHPTAFMSVVPYLNYRAVWGSICEYHNGLILPRYQIPHIENIETLLHVDPFFTLQIGFFVKRKDMPLFDESMDCGEDWDVYLKLWGKGNCLKQEYAFMVNRRGLHSTGPRSANGRQWRESVEKQIKEALSENTFNKTAKVISLH